MPAKRAVSIDEKEETTSSDILTESQLAPLLVDRNMPPPQVPEKRLVSLAARTLTHFTLTWDSGLNDHKN